MLTLPILPGIDGVEKMSKSKGNQIGITDPPEEMFGKTMRLPDEAMDTWFALLAIEPPPDGHVAAGRQARAGAGDHRALPRRARRRRRRRRRSTASSSTTTIPDDVAVARVSAENGRLHLPAALAEAFGISRSEARRLLAQGGVKVDGETLPADELDVDVDVVDDKVVQVGRRQFRRLQVER